MSPTENVTLMAWLLSSRVRKRNFDRARHDRPVVRGADVLFHASLGESRSEMLPRTIASRNWFANTSKGFGAEMRLMTTGLRVSATFGACSRGGRRC